VFVALSEAARTYLEGLMNWKGYEYKSDFARRYFAEGEAEGEANALLDVLEARGIEVSDRERELIVGCQDVSQLKEWVRRAATATSLDEVIAYERH
jgi:hypothetical protein